MTIQTGTAVEKKKIGSYTVVRLLGSGGMGQVYEAVHDQIQRRAAIKVLHKRFNNNRQIAQRFINEARAVNIVRHPSLVNIYEFGQESDGSTYIVMEYLDGETLRQRLERLGGKLPPEMAVRLCRQIASALSAAHQKNIIHRDLKPVNIMIVPDSEATGGERAKVLDFGLAKVVLPDGESGASGLTHTGTILGTPAYMAPEQCRSARQVDDKSDVYALGVILYEMLSSDIPFDAETDAELLSMHMYKEPPLLSERAPGLDPRLVKLVHRMLAKQQADRPSAAEVVSELDGTAVLRTPAQAGIAPAGPSSQSFISEEETVVTPQKGAPSLPRHAAAASLEPKPSQTSTSPSASSPSSSRGALIALGVILVVLAAIFGGVLGWVRGRQSAPSALAPVPAIPTVRCSISSIPAGAEVLSADNQLIGRTPLMLENRRGAGPVSYTLRLAGYAEVKISVPLDRDEVLGVTLTAQPQAAAPQATAPAHAGDTTSSLDGGPGAGADLSPGTPAEATADEPAKRVTVVD